MKEKNVKGNLMDTVYHIIVLANKYGNEFKLHM